jgi:hypothetical protein
MPESERSRRSEDDAETAASRSRELVQEAVEKVARDEAYSTRTVTVPQRPPASNGSDEHKPGDGAYRSSHYR